MRFVVFIIFTSFCSAVYGQEGYKIDFEIAGWKDTTAYLGNYFGESTLLRDTAKVNSKGQFSFSGTAELRQGIYFIVLAKTRMFDFALGPDKVFKLSSNSKDLLGEMKVSGDEDNRIFFENVRYNIERHKEATPFVEILQDTAIGDSTDRKKMAKAGFHKINEKVLAHQHDVINEYPTSIAARAFKAAMPVPIPDPPKRPDGTIDSTFRYHYYRQHFFDNFDLSDEALLMLPQPLYKEKLNEYLNKMLIPLPDTIEKEIDRLALIAKKNPETFKYYIYAVLGMYQTPEIMGLDEVFVHMNKKYFESGDMDYAATAQIKKNIKDYSEKISRGMIGRKGPNLLMQDVNLQPRSMYDIRKKYTILFFFDPDCGHCRQETPKLVDFYTKNKTKFDVEVYAISVDSSMKKLKDYIKEMKMAWITVDGPRSFLKEHYSMLYYSELTPTLYILDSEKKVIARKLPVEKIEEFLTNYEKYHPKKPGKGT